VRSAPESPADCTEGIAPGGHEHEAAASFARNDNAPATRAAHLPSSQDPAHPHVSNDEFRVTGRQPTSPMGDPNSPDPQAQRAYHLRKSRFPPARELLAGRRRGTRYGDTPANDSDDYFHDPALSRTGRNLNNFINLRPTWGRAQHPA
jgi:hypothetical protein